MPAMRRLATLAIAVAAALPMSSASAVGLGPLAKSGVTAGPRKAFYLTLINPYQTATEFRAYAIGWEDEQRQPRVRILPGETVTLGGGSQRQLLVIAGGLSPGETYSFRVCAERARQIQGMIHARVCSKLSARRLAAR